MCLDKLPLLELRWPQLATGQRNCFFSMGFDGGGEDAVRAFVSFVLLLSLVRVVE